MSAVDEHPPFDPSCLTTKENEACSSLEPFSLNSVPADSASPPSRPSTPRSLAPFAAHLDAAQAELARFSPSPAPTYRTSASSPRQHRPPLPTIPPLPPLSKKRFSVALAASQTMGAIPEKTFTLDNTALPPPSDPAAAKAARELLIDQSYAVPERLSPASTPPAGLEHAPASAQRTSPALSQPHHSAAPAMEDLEVLQESVDAATRETVERWRSGQRPPNGEGRGFYRRPSDAKSAVSVATSAFSTGSASQLAGMTDAEIAQQHFRLAQQHLEAAQRLAMAAASQPDRPSPAGASSVAGSSASRPRRREDEYEDSVYDPDEPAHSPVSPQSGFSGDIASEFGSLSINDAVDVYDRRNSRFMTTSALGSFNASPLATRDRGASLSSTSTRSLPTRVSRASESAQPAAMAPPAPQRRATIGTGMSMTPLESASALAPSLYGGVLPVGISDRLGNGSGSAGSSVRDSPVPMPPQPHHQGMEDDELVTSDAGHDWDDGASDYYDSQSAFSHVTYATLPPYELDSAPPPVPALPAQYAAEAAAAPRPRSSAQPSSISSGTESVATIQGPPQPLDHVPAPPGSPVGEFHGFRPRAAPQPPPTRTVVNAPSPYAISRPNFQSFTMPQQQLQPQGYHAITTPSQGQPHAYVASAPATTGAGAPQPLSYILGPNGQPIPVYAAGAFSAPAAARPAPSQPMPYSHAIPSSRPSVMVSSAPHAPPYSTHQSYTSSSAPVPSYPVSSSPGGILAHSTSSASLSPHPYASPSSSHSSFSLPPTRPASAGSNESARTTFSTATGSMRTRMASLRAKVKSPHVRFKSPEPEEARRRASRVPGSGTGGLGTSRRKNGDAGGEMRSVFEDDEDGENLSPEARVEKQRQAMAMSFSMLT
ncbi:hypothetical protein JCM10207_005773 [Rhodosporidiobolus poonsookiae]